MMRLAATPEHKRRYTREQLRGGWGSAGMRPERRRSGGPAEVFPTSGLPSVCGQALNPGVIGAQPLSKMSHFLIDKWWGVPPMGPRFAELMEMPVMFAVIVLAARWVVRHFSR